MENSLINNFIINLSSGFKSSNEINIYDFRDKSIDEIINKITIEDGLSIKPFLSVWNKLLMDNQNLNNDLSEKITNFLSKNQYLTEEWISIKRKFHYNLENNIEKQKNKGFNFLNEEELRMTLDVFLSENQFLSEINTIESIDPEKTIEKININIANNELMNHSLI